MKVFNSLCIVCFLILGMIGCEEDSDTPKPVLNLLEIHKSNLDNLGLDIQVFSEKDLVVGYNRLKISLQNPTTKRQFTNARLSVLPIMEMPNVIHSAPKLIPLDFLDENRFFQQDIVFLIPSSDSGSWHLNLNVKDLDSGKQQNIDIPVEVGAPEAIQLQSFLSEVDQRNIFVSLVEPNSPQTGLNDFQLGIHYRENMLSFPTLRNLQVEIEPEMLEMGHGSEGNINPVYSPGGLYRGNVYFNMEGLWRVNIRVKDSTGAFMGETYFEMDF